MTEPEGVKPVKPIPDELHENEVDPWVKMFEIMVWMVVVGFLIGWCFLHDARAADAFQGKTESPFMNCGKVAYYAAGIENSAKKGWTMKQNREWRRAQTKYWSPELHMALIMVVQLHYTPEKAKNECQRLHIIVPHGLMVAS